MNILLVGAGQLGSRHLQGLKAANLNANITVVDPSAESLKVAKERCDAVTSTFRKEVSYTQELPASGDWDICIVATNSKGRFHLIKNLMSRYSVKNYVFEKILFSSECEYIDAEKAFDKIANNAFVNCCMRQMDIYTEINKVVNGQVFDMTVTGSKFGLVTNFIHYLDYAYQLSGKQSFEVDFSLTSKNLAQSKRAGYFECNGIIGVSFKNGSRLTVNCFDAGTLPVTISVSTPSVRYIVDEFNKVAYVQSDKNGWRVDSQVITIPFQSQLTADTLTRIHEKSPIPLTPLKESVEIHLGMVKAFKKNFTLENSSGEQDFLFT